MTGIERYQARIEEARQGLATLPAVQAVLTDALDDATFLRFLLEHAARSVAITEPVDGWIRRAGEGCVDLGLTEVGRQLILHARHEAGHHEMLIADVAALSRTWNHRFPNARLDPSAFVGRGANAAGQAYIDLHERVVTGARPYLQVAIELEIEKLSTTAGGGFVARAQAVLGPDVPLSFMKEHVAIDVGHTAFNERLLQRLLAIDPDALDPLVETAQEALRIYGALVTECLTAARRDTAAAQAMAEGPRAG